MEVGVQLPEKQFVVGAEISKTSYGEVVELCSLWIAENKSGLASRARYICVVDVHSLMTAKNDPYIAGCLEAADIATPDGMPLVWALRSFGFRNQERVYGPTLMLHLCDRAAREGHRIFLYGGTEATLPLLQSRLESKYPGLQFAGAISPPFRELSTEEDEHVQRAIVDSKADLVFIGTGTPKQDRWMFEHRDSLPGKILVGVGAAFDFHAGVRRQAPAWMQNHGLEWLFRLGSEPARLWRRYLLITPRFLPYWGVQLVRSLGAKNALSEPHDSVPSSPRHSLNVFKNLLHRG